MTYTKRFKITDPAWGVEASIPAGDSATASYAPETGVTYQSMAELQAKINATAPGGTLNLLGQFFGAEIPLNFADREGSLKQSVSVDEDITIKNGTLTGSRPVNWTPVTEGPYSGYLSGTMPGGAYSIYNISPEYEFNTLMGIDGNSAYINIWTGDGQWDGDKVPNIYDSSNPAWTQHSIWPRPPAKRTLYPLNYSGETWLGIQSDYDDTLDAGTILVVDTKTPLDVNGDVFPAPAGAEHPVRRKGILPAGDVTTELAAKAGSAAIGDLWIDASSPNTGMEGVGHIWTGTVWNNVGDTRQPGADTDYRDLPRIRSQGNLLNPTSRANNSNALGKSRMIIGFILDGPDGSATRTQINDKFEDIGILTAGTPGTFTSKSIMCIYRAGPNSISHVEVDSWNSDTGEMILIPNGSSYYYTGYMQFAFINHPGLIENENDISYDMRNKKIYYKAPAGNSGIDARVSAVQTAMTVLSEPDVTIDGTKFTACSRNGGSTAAIEKIRHASPATQSSETALKLKNCYIWRNYHGIRGGLLDMEGVVLESNRHYGCTASDGSKGLKSYFLDTDLAESLTVFNQTGAAWALTPCRKTEMESCVFRSEQTNHGQGFSLYSGSWKHAHIQHCLFLNCTRGTSMQAGSDQKPEGFTHIWENNWFIYDAVPEQKVNGQRQIDFNGGDMDQTIFADPDGMIWKFVNNGIVYNDGSENDPNNPASIENPAEWNSPLAAMTKKIPLSEVVVANNICASWLSSDDGLAAKFPEDPYVNTQAIARWSSFYGGDANVPQMVSTTASPWPTNAQTYLNNVKYLYVQGNTQSTSDWCASRDAANAAGNFTDVFDYANLLPRASGQGDAAGENFMTFATDNGKVGPRWGGDLTIAKLRNIPLTYVDMQTAQASEGYQAWYDEFPAQSIPTTSLSWLGNSNDDTLYFDQIS